MEIREVNQREYEAFLQKNEHHLFIDTNWLGLVVENHLKVVFQGLFVNGKLVDVFPIVYQVGRFMKYITTPLFTPHLGTCSDKYLGEVLSFLKKQKVASTSYPFFNEIVGIETCQTYQLDLTKSNEELWNNLRSDKKRNIKKAIKEKLNVTVEKDTSLLFPLLEKTFERQGHTFTGYKVLSNIISKYSNVIQVNVWDEQDCIASSLVVFDKDVAYYLIGGFDSSKEKYYAGPFSLWTAIHTCKEAGIRVFDFEGSMIPSIATYFESFGAQIKNYSFFKDESCYFQMVKKLMK